MVLAGTAACMARTPSTTHRQLAAQARRRRRHTPRRVSADASNNMWRRKQLVLAGKAGTPLTTITNNGKDVGVQDKSDTPGEAARPPATNTDKVGKRG